MDTLKILIYYIFIGTIGDNILQKVYVCLQYTNASLNGHLPSILVFFPIINQKHDT